MSTSDRSLSEKENIIELSPRPAIEKSNSLIQELKRKASRYKNHLSCYLMTFSRKSSARRSKTKKPLAGLSTLSSKQSKNFNKRTQKLMQKEAKSTMYSSEIQFPKTRMNVRAFHIHISLKSISYRKFRYSPKLQSNMRKK